MKTNKLIPVVILFICCTCFGQIQDYKYKRQLKNVTSDWQLITLPDSIYRELNDDLSDLRIIKIVGTDTVEIPYISSFRFENQEEKEQYFSLINRTRSDKGFYYTYKLPSIRKLNRLLIKTELENFDWRVDLEGSSDGLSWFIIADNYRITAFSNNDTSFSFTELKFADCEFLYYRLNVKTGKDPEIRNAAFFLDEKMYIENSWYEGITFSVKNDKQKKQSVIDITLPLKVPVSYIHPIINSEGFFLRPLTIQYLADSSKSPKGWIQNYNYSLSASIDSRTGNEFFIPEVITNKIKLIIDNSDNQPLSFSSFQIRRINHWLLFRVGEGGNCYLLYGNKNAGFPDYDIAKQYKDNSSLPKAANISLGFQEAVIPTELSGNSFAVYEKILLYTIIVIGVILLMFYLFRMLKQVK